jgi:hypothetical protein
MLFRVLMLMILISTKLPDLHAHDQEIIFEKIAGGFLEENPKEIYFWLNHWSREFPERDIESQLVQSFVISALGWEKEGKDLFFQNIEMLRTEGRYSKEQIDFICDLYSAMADLEQDDSHILLCKHKKEPYQPFGLRMKYWLGAGALVLSVITLPFSPPTSAFLFGTGVSTLVDAVPNLLENKIKHDKGLPPYDRHIQDKIEGD